LENPRDIFDEELAFEEKLRDRIIGIIGDWPKRAR
jgi:hypothetical protein